jgi:toxin HigB-1
MRIYLGDCFPEARFSGRCFIRRPNKTAEERLICLRSNRLPRLRGRPRKPDGTLSVVRCGLAVPLVNRRSTPYTVEWIKRFRHKGLEALFRTGGTKGVNARLAAKLRRALLRLNDGPLPEAMDLPGFRLHRLKGNRDGVWSVSITGNSRLTFETDGEDATNVDLEDYH